MKLQFKLFGARRQPQAKPVELGDLLLAARQAGISGDEQPLRNLIARKHGYLNTETARRVMAYLLKEELSAGNRAQAYPPVRHLDLVRNLLALAPSLNFKHSDPVIRGHERIELNARNGSEPALLALFFANTGRPEYLDLFLEKKAITPRMAQRLMAHAEADASRTLTVYIGANTVRHPAGKLAA